MASISLSAFPLDFKASISASLVLHALVLPVLTLVFQQAPLSVPSTAPVFVEMDAPRTRPSTPAPTQPERKVSAPQTSQSTPKPLDVPEQPSATVEKTASAVGNPTSGALSEEQSYAAKLRRYLESRRHYPRRAKRMGQAGTVVLGLHITKVGDVTNVSVLKPCKFPLLNEAALAMGTGLRKFDPLPDSLGDHRDFHIPIEFRL